MPTNTYKPKTALRAFFLIYGVHHLLGLTFSSTQLPHWNECSMLTTSMSLVWHANELYTRLTSQFQHFCIIFKDSLHLSNKIYSLPSTVRVCCPDNRTPSLFVACDFLCRSSSHVGASYSCKVVDFLQAFLKAFSTLACKVPSLVDFIYLTSSLLFG